MFSREERNAIFKHFWNMSWKEKHLYVSTPIKKEATQRNSNRKVEGASKRSCAYKFYLPKFEGMKLKVCKTMFDDTIAIKPWTITHQLNSKSTHSQGNVGHEIAQNPDQTS